MPQLLKQSAVLRALQPSDCDLLYRWRNSERVRQFMFNDQLIAWTDHQKWFEKALKDPDSAYLVFAYNERPTGLVYFPHIDTHSGTCEWGFYRGEESPAPGSSRAMGYLAIDYGFTKLQLRKICAKSLATNKAGLDFHHYFGFRVEGRLNKHIRRAEDFIDVICLGLLKDDWLSRRGSVSQDLFSGEAH